LSTSIGGEAMIAYEVVHRAGGALENRAQAKSPPKASCHGDIFDRRSSNCSRR
jgi:hypothetical protein